MCIKERVITISDSKLWREYSLRFKICESLINHIICPMSYITNHWHMTRYYIDDANNCRTKYIFVFSLTLISANRSCSSECSTISFLLNNHKANIYNDLRLASDCLFFVSFSLSHILPLLWQGRTQFSQLDFHNLLMSAYF